MVDAPESVYEQRGRRLKAERMAVAIMDAKLTAQQVEEHAGYTFWKTVCDETGLRMPSEKTRALVIEIVKERENAEKTK